MPFIRHAFLILAATSLPTLAVAQAAPPLRQVPLTETVHGITLQDEYRWIEQPAALPEWNGWVTAQSQRTRAMLDALPARADYARLITTTSSSLVRQGGYQQGGATAIWLRALPGEQTMKLIVRDAAGTRVLVDPAKVAGNELGAIGAFTLSPDGTTAAVQVSSAGSEVGSVHFFDTASGREAYPAIPHVWGERSATFLPNGMIAFTQMATNPPDGDPLKGMTAYLRPLAGGASVKVLGAGFPGTDVTDAEFPGVYHTALSPFALGFAGGARADNKAFVTPLASLLAGKPTWKPFITLDDKVGGVALRGNTAFMISAHDNGARDLLARPLGPDGVPGAPRVLMHGTDRLILQDVTATRDGLYLFASTDGVARLFFYPDAAGPPREVPLPFEGTTEGSVLSGDESALLMPLTGWSRNLATYRIAGGQLTPTGIESGAWSGASNIAVDRYEAVSADGTKVPLVVTRLKSSTGRIPTLVEAYGGYGIDTSTPFYNRNGMAFIARGGAMAYCGVRGGGERGRAWHEAGRGRNKPRGQEDLIACAETLTAKRVAPRQGPVAIGSSMAGTLVPEAALRKPQAFGGMITRVGIVNASRLAAAENGANQMVEMGDPAVPAQYADLVAMDGYQLIPRSAALPPTMMLIGMNDKRVAPWMTAKFVARAQAKWPTAPIWLRSDTRAGHGMGSTEDVRRDEWSDIFAFAWAQQQPR
ncbi:MULTISPECIES: prolyl oligopeptidase family serine peptidase [Sphingomonas]|uniref:prolyl oligopeptidase family serine peptidase n=1 Tax=Sphingomonas TaxID=13687 RepID=UPI000DEF03BB|nr:MULTISPECIES: prolyl oligopeptidase family serine peptidase [Sphingomonas]